MGNEIGNEVLAGSGQEGRSGRLSAAVLKNTACVLMVLGTVAYMTAALFGVPGSTGYTGMNLLAAGLSNIAFVLFVFLLTEGFVHTSSRKGYILRLLVCAFVSELPFDLSHYGTGNMISQNVLFTYLAAFLTLIGIEAICKRFGKTDGGNDGKAAGIKPVGIVLIVLLVLAGMLAAELVRGELGCVGVALTVVFYLLREKKILSLAVALPVFFVCQILYELIISGVGQLFAKWTEHAPETVGAVISGNIVEICIKTVCVLAGMILIFFYNGRKGYQADKIVYYLLYPLHMLLSVLIALLVAFIVAGL